MKEYILLLLPRFLRKQTISPTDLLPSEPCNFEDESEAQPAHKHGNVLQDVKHKIERDFVSTYLAELAFWPAFQAFNFAKVPVRHQLLAVNSACLLDATFLCW